MKRISKKSTLALAVLMLAAIAVTLAAAQNPPGPPKPGPEVAKLKFFLGSWKITGDIKPGPMGPGGKFTGTGKNEWMPGGFFIEGHEIGNMAAMGKVTSTAYLGYDQENKVYTYDEFASTGEHTVAKGTVEGDTWTWTSETKEAGKVVKGRFIEKVTSPTSYDFKFEASIDGGEYQTFLEGKATKAGAAAGAKPASGKAAPGDAGKPKTN
ncbi:MAG TPA: DUF1579 family protein [Candidatus Angelobacter sp.]|nr:DUF1579 family protein [Candidatus Angelobacter sp.]